MLNPQEDSQNQLKDITERFQSNFDLGVIYLLFNKSKLIILLFFIISFVSTFIYLRYSQPVFESKAVIQINNSNQSDDILKLNSLQIIKQFFIIFRLKLFMIFIFIMM